MIEWVGKYVGIPYKLHERSMEKCDCYGLALLIYKNELKIDLPIFDERYDIESDGETIVKIFESQFDKWKNVISPKIGDLLYLRIAGIEKHIGIYVGDDQFLHNLRKGGSSTIANINNPKWKRRIIGFYRYE